MVADNDQTAADAATSFTVSTTDVDPGTIHVDMRGSEHAELTSIKGAYISAVNTTIGTAADGDTPATGLRKAQSDAAGLEQTLREAITDRDAVFSSTGSSGFVNSGAVSAEIGRLEGLETTAKDLEKDLKDAREAKANFLAILILLDQAGFVSSVVIGNEVKRLEDLASSCLATPRRRCQKRQQLCEACRLEPKRPKTTLQRHRQLEIRSSAI